MPDPLSRRSRSEPVNVQPKPPQISYWFFGKIALFPIIMMFLAAGAVALFIFRRHLSDEAPEPGTTGLSGYLTSEDLSYGLAGLVLSIICAIMLIFFLFWHVIRISFTFDAQEGKFTVSKRGIFRKSTLEFDMSDMSFHYFRTHFAENKRWLQFVVREGDIYFQIYSWRGKGSQTDTFLNLFQRLQYQLERAQEQMLMPIHPSSKYPTEIVSKEEFTLIGPFTARLKGFVARQRNVAVQSKAQQLYDSGPSATYQHGNANGYSYSPFNSNGSSGFPEVSSPQGGRDASSIPTWDPANASNNYSQARNHHHHHHHHHQRSTKSRNQYSSKSALDQRGWAQNLDISSLSSDQMSGASSICEEQIEMVDYDSLLRHFKYEKVLGGPIMPGEAKSGQSDLSSVVRKA